MLKTESVRVFVRFGVRSETELEHKRLPRYVYDVL